MAGGAGGLTRETAAGLVRRSSQRIPANPARVITALFVPGQEGFDLQESRTSSVLTRVLALDDDEAQDALDDVMERCDHRHRHLVQTFERNADVVAERLDPGLVLSTTRRLLVGATFTNEYAIEGAALCNPSMVAHPDQSGLPTDSLRFVMSTRAVGEGHRSSIGFRTGNVDASGSVTFDEPPQFAVGAQTSAAALDAAVFRGELDRMRGGGEDADYIFDALGEHFTRAELDQRLHRLDAQPATRQHGKRTTALIRKIADRTYSARFADETALSERVLLPAMSAECNGMEDARFVRLVEEDGTTRYYATYTAYDGADIRQQLLETSDFQNFTSSPLTGPAAANKGLALFPRRIGGRFVALSRSDRESNTITSSVNLHHWGRGLPCQVPARAWEMLQLGNCGSPIETDAGWLALTHGVGPMRTYGIGAALLDLDDPTHVVGQLRRPLLRALPDEQDGYVPNVVYSCGALLHNGTLVLPYGIGDSAIGVATVPVAALLADLTGTSRVGVSS